MGFTAKILADGQVANSLGDIYTVGALTKAYVRTLNFFNTNAATQTILVYLKPAGGTDREIARYVLAQNERAEYGRSFAMGAGDKIRAVTTTAAAVDFVASGVEET